MKPVLVYSLPIAAFLYEMYKRFFSDGDLLKETYSGDHGQSLALALKALDDNDAYTADEKIEVARIMEYTYDNFLTLCNVECGAAAFDIYGSINSHVTYTKVHARVVRFQAENPYNVVVIVPNRITDPRNGESNFRLGDCDTYSNPRSPYYGIVAIYGGPPFNPFFDLGWLGKSYNRVTSMDGLPIN